MSAIALTTAQSRFLRGQAHELKPLLQVGGKGLGDGLLAEFEQLLEDHELVKVRIAAEDRAARDALIAALGERSSAALVQRIGHVAVFFRPSRDKRRIVLPRA
ncbi:ribosome assembly RNA-binding protein YhbY [Luteimonas sp. e5]